MDAEGEQPRKKRGAPQGNLNAFKHGVYTRWFRQFELTELDQISGSNLHEEITMLRVLMQRLFELVSQESLDLETMSKALTALGKGAYHLGSLLRTEKELVGDANDVTAALSKAFAGVLEDIEK